MPSSSGQEKKTEIDHGGITSNRGTLLVGQEGGFFKNPPEGAKCHKMRYQDVGRPQDVLEGVGIKQQCLNC
jgi:hypothetical protein